MSSIFQNAPPEKYLFQDGLMNALARLGNNITITGTVGATTIHSFILPGGTLLRSGQSLYIVSRTTRNNASNITLNLNTNGSTRGSYTLPAGASVIQYLVAICTRLANGNLNVSTILFRDLSGTSTGAAIVMQGADTTLSFGVGQSLDNTDVLFEVSVIVGGAGDTITETSLVAFVI